MKTFFELSYGCEEWQEVEVFADVDVAYTRLDELCTDRPTMGGYPATYLILRKTNGGTISSITWEEE